MIKRYWEAIKNKTIPCRNDDINYLLETYGNDLLVNPDIDFSPWRFNNKVFISYLIKLKIIIHFCPNDGYMAHSKKFDKNSLIKFFDHIYNSPNGYHYIMKEYPEFQYKYLKEIDNIEEFYNDYHFNHHRHPHILSEIISSDPINVNKFQELYLSKRIVESRHIFGVHPSLITSYFFSKDYVDIILNDNYLSYGYLVSNRYYAHGLHFMNYKDILGFINEHGHYKYLISPDYLLEYLSIIEDNSLSLNYNHSHKKKFLEIGSNSKYFRYDSPQGINQIQSNPFFQEIYRQDISYEDLLQIVSHDEIIGQSLLIGYPKTPSSILAIVKEQLEKTNNEALKDLLKQHKNYKGTAGSIIDLINKS